MARVNNVIHTFREFIYLFRKMVSVSIFCKIRHLTCIIESNQETIPYEHELGWISIATSVCRNRKGQSCIDPHLEVFTFSYHGAQGLLHLSLQKKESMNYFNNNTADINSNPNKESRIKYSTVTYSHSNVAVQ